MMQRFGLVTGLSDHTLDNTTAIASVVLGPPLSRSTLFLTTMAATRTIASRWNRQSWLALCRALGLR